MKLVVQITGCAIRTLLLYASSNWLNIPGDDKFPFGTFSVNVAGTVVIGLLAGRFSSGDLSSNMKNFLFTGLLGGFTPFTTLPLNV